MGRLRKAKTDFLIKRSRNCKYIYKFKSLPAKFVEDTEYSEESKESQRLLDYSKVMKEKWVALSLFCALAFTQSYIWNTWSPIVESVLIAFPSWSRGSVSFLSNWGCISYLLCCFPSCYILYKKGLFCPIRIAVCLTTLAAAIRCVFINEFAFKIAVNLSAALNGISGVIIGCATSLISAVWFPTGQRTTATGISSAFNQMGVAISFIIGPSLVKESSSFNVLSKNNDTFHLNKSLDFKYHKDNISSDSSLHQMELQSQIISLMRIEFVIQFLIFCGILWFYPKHQLYQRPSVMHHDISLFKSICILTRMKSIWLLNLSAALSQGATSPWLNMITTIFKSKLSQLEADNVAFWTITFSSILGLLLSRIMDSFQGRLKIAINLMLTLSSIMFVWILLLDNRILTFHVKELYAAIILGVAICWSTSPLFLELASEIAFPISEAVVAGYMIFFINIIGCMFYSLHYIPKMGERWLTNCVLGHLIVATFVSFCIKDDYNRSKLEVLDDNFIVLFKNKNFMDTNSCNNQVLLKGNSL